MCGPHCLAVSLMSSSSYRQTKMLIWESIAKQKTCPNPIKCSFAPSLSYEGVSNEHAPYTCTHLHLRAHFVDILKECPNPTKRPSFPNHNTYMKKFQTHEFIDALSNCHFGSSMHADSSLLTTSLLATRSFVQSTCALRIKITAPGF